MVDSKEWYLNDYRNGWTAYHNAMKKLSII